MRNTYSIAQLLMCSAFICDIEQYKPSLSRVTQCEADPTNFEMVQRIFIKIIHNLRLLNVLTRIYTHMMCKTSFLARLLIFIKKGGLLQLKFGAGVNIYLWAR